jgi:ubiquinone/menaquinone biosynthesis C-methylase UbiE
MHMRIRAFVEIVAEKPIVFDILRRIIEANYVSLKRVIKKEFALGSNNEKYSMEEKILDVPCGTGEFSSLFTPETYYGLDISDKYINYAQKKYNRRFYCRDAIQSGFNDNYFDKILMLGFLHHLDDSLVVSVLKEIKRILKPYGMLLLIEDAPTRSQWNIIGKALQRYDIGSNIRTADEYKKILQRYFMLRKYYHVTSGFWDYSVFVLSPEK